jgi:AraC family transcriptional regulator
VPDFKFGSLIRGIPFPFQSAIVKRVRNKQTVPILLSVSRKREWHLTAPVAGTTVKLPFANIEHWWMPPHSQDGFTSVTRAGSIGVSFSAHRRAVHQHRGAPVRQTNIAAGAAFITLSGELQWLEVVEPSEALEIHLNGPMFDEVAKELGASRRIVLSDIVAEDDPVVLSASSTLRAQLLHTGAVDEMHAETIVRALVGHTLREYGGLRTPRPLPGRIDMRRLRRVAALVRARLHERLSLADLAEQAALTPFHFARSFRLTTGMTPHGFVRAARMQRAAELARSTLLSTAALAERVGYAHIAHFRTAFVQTFGCTPAVLRASTTNIAARG